MNIWRDPERWVDSDMQRNEYLLLLKYYGLLLLAAFIVTGLAIGAGIFVASW